MSDTPGPLARAHAKMRGIWAEALRERTSPRELGVAVAVGALAGSSPLIGFHAAVALGLASLFKLNRVAAFAGSNVTFGPLMPLIMGAEIAVGRKLLGTEAPLPERFALANALSRFGLAWWAGWVVVGGGLALVLGVTSYGVARAKRGKEKSAETETP